MTDQELVDRAIKMQEFSYVPYSRFPVGAALLCDDGTVFTGCNVEYAWPWRPGRTAMSLTPTSPWGPPF